ncbi:unnamed protein product [Rotaria sp. Silwood2]|nr:unnamed protein product [Rotaria sp. Silwood2]CAF4224873.1 unnamed protein product [Rotaria sp. Silwood2]CAF4245997.1 unnamed protein product [Rotaria sp. Silwood2]
MEGKRSRQNSVSSVHSQSNSLIAVVQCPEEHTHAIVQREKDNKVILVPLDCFINFGKTVKVNETATYRSTTDSRKSERGKVLLFGSEDLCVEQLQIIEEENIEEDQILENTKNKSNSSSAILNNTNCEKRSMDIKKKIKINDRFDASTPKKTNSASSITFAPPTRLGKKTSQVKRKLFNDNTDFLSTNENIFEEDEVYEINDCSKKSKFNNVAVSELSAKQITDVNHQILSKNLISTASLNQARSQPMLKSVTHEDDSTEDSEEEEANEKNQSEYVSREKHNRLERRLQKKKNEIVTLQKQIDFYKKNYVPLPNAGARSWFINVGKRLGEQLSAKTICEHATLINNINPNALLTCIDDSGTATGRKIIRALFSEEELSGKTGPEAVSKQLREAIRNFVELHHGVIPKHDFNEAINGVFRQAKRDKENVQRFTMVPSVKKQKTDYNQQKITKMLCSKKSTSSVANKTTTMCSNTILDHDDDHRLEGKQIVNIFFVKTYIDQA